jgi:hypothetical protein
MTVALIALFISLGGTGYAITKINGKQLVDRSVSAKKIQKNSLTSTEVRTAALSDRTRQLLVPRAPKKAHKGAVRVAEADPTAVGTTVTMSTGDTRTLFTKGPFTVFAICEDRGNGVVRVAIYANRQSPERGFPACPSPVRSPLTNQS